MATFCVLLCKCCNNTHGVLVVQLFSHAFLVVSPTILTLIDDHQAFWAELEEKTGMTCLKDDDKQFCVLQGQIYLIYFVLTCLCFVLTCLYFVIFMVLTEEVMLILSCWALGARYLFTKIYKFNGEITFITIIYQVM